MSGSNCRRCKQGCSDKGGSDKGGSDKEGNLTRFVGCGSLLKLAGRGNFAGEGS